MSAGLLHRKLSLLNFDHTYEYQTQLRTSFPHDWIDFTDISGKNLYCDRAAQKAINDRLDRYWQPGITFIGNGNFHYVSYFLQSRIQRPYTLLVIDHHTDMMDNGPLITCGSWVSWALTYLPIQHALLVGPESNADIPVQCKNRVSLYPERLSSALTSRLLSQINSNPVYISIDKDILDIKYAHTNWDQGHLTVSALKDLIQVIIQRCQVIGVDVCGEWPAPHGVWIMPRHQTAIKKNEQVNEQLARLLLNHKAVHHIGVS